VFGGGTRFVTGKTGFEIGCGKGDFVGRGGGGLGGEDLGFGS